MPNNNFDSKKWKEFRISLIKEDISEDIMDADFKKTILSIMPFSYDGSIVDKNNRTIIKANRESGTTPLPPHYRDLLLKLVCDLLNNSVK